MMRTKILATLSSALLVSALAIGVQAPLALTSQAVAGSTPWLDRDNPGGKGDYEDTKHLLKQSCKVGKKELPQGEPTSGKWKGYHNVSPMGCWCVNAETKGGVCKDIRIKYSW